VGYLLRMSGEIRDWLADLRDSDPVAARRVGEALTALITEGPALGPPVVVSLADPGPPDDPAEALEGSYNDRLEQTQEVRAHHAEAEKLLRDIEQQIADLQSQEISLGDERYRALGEGKPDEATKAVEELATVQSQLADLRRLLPGVVKAEQELRTKAQHLQSSVDSFRSRKESLSATHAAAQAQQSIRDAINALSRDLGYEEPRERPEDADAGAAATLKEVADKIKAELGSPGSADDLMELRPGGDNGILVLFAVEPAGTALLIAVLEGHEAIRDDHDEAVGLSGEVLEQVRYGQAPEATALTFEDAPSFLDEFFPGSAAEVEAGAAALVARNRARTLAGQRVLLGLSQRDVAERMSVRPERVEAIERAEPGATEVRTLASYVEALGGRLEIIADFGGERVVLR
jgi:phage shock protein A